MGHNTKEKHQYISITLPYITEVHVSDDNRISLQVDLGIDLAKMYQMIIDIHQEVVLHRARQETLEEHVQQLMQRIHELEHAETDILTERADLTEDWERQKKSEHCSWNM